MMNSYAIKRWASYLLAGVGTTAVLVVMILSGADIVLSAVVAFLANILFGILSRRFLLAHPLLDYLEGKGILVKSVDSTGMIRTFVVQLSPPYLQGELDGKRVEDVFDRSAMMYETTPAKVQGEDTGDEIVIRIPKEQYHTLQFREYVYPVFIWNANLKTFLTKDALAKLESDALLDHALLYLMRKVEELNGLLRDFGRYVMDTARPTWFSLQEFIKRHPLLFILVLIGIVVAVIVMFFPGVMGGAAEDALGGAVTAADSIVQPLGGE